MNSLPKQRMRSIYEQVPMAKYYWIPGHLSLLLCRLKHSILANVISPIGSPVKRAFYEMEAIRGCWSVKELKRQINSLYYDRSGLSKNEEALSAMVQRQAMSSWN